MSDSDIYPVPLNDTLNNPLNAPQNDSLDSALQGTTGDMSDGNPSHTSPVFTGPILRTFFYYVIPSIVGLIAITTASLVDGVVVGNYLGPEALAAITLLIPYFTLLFGIALMLAIGGSVRVGKYIGEQNIAAASAMFSKSLIATFVISSVAALITSLADDTLYRILGAPESLIPTLSAYFQVITWVMVLQLVTMVLYYFVRADDHPILATSALITGAVLNILFDILFIGYLDMGIAGAAYATGIAQVIQLLILGRYFISPKKTLSFSLRQQQWRELIHSAYNGVSEFINELSGGLIIFLLNWLLISRMGVDGVAAFTIVNYLIFLSLMMAYGIADALHLLVSQNFGAQNHRRIQHFLMTSLCSVALLGIGLVCLLTLAQTSVVHAFLDADQTHIAELSQTLIGFIWPLFLVNGANIMLSCYLTAIHQPTPSAAVALSRSLLLPGGLLLVLFWLLPGWSFLTALPIAEWLTFLLACVLCFRWRPSQLARQR
ncbi:MATE family efflux transporter [Litoribrevibacter albus]|uniref:MATE family efflux transporter n=1 Tax=Litoribrevibacter albus TaxID=1473156 RepID=A0AA37W7N6_9GAMM|nr:MATE family efflux transporter [Litoribrevibacter albus]GLQ32860.1 MATE family efflux transporter [Litoribrevibacter albus]